MQPSHLFDYKLWQGENEANEYWATTMTALLDANVKPKCNETKGKKPPTVHHTTNGALVCIFRLKFYQQLFIGCLLYIQNL